MDLQSRKLNMIEYLITLKDEHLFKKIESLIFENQSTEDSKKKFMPFTQDQLIDRANKSNQDYNNGKIKTQEQLEKESETW